MYATTMKDDVFNIGSWTISSIQLVSIADTLHAFDALYYQVSIFMVDYFNIDYIGPIILCRYELLKFGMSVCMWISIRLY